MTLGEIDIWLLLDILILLLIGMGPKVALVPFLDLTAGMDSDTRKDVARRMVRTATTVALVPLVLGAFLMKLLHFSEPALYIAGGIVFLLVALRMLAEAGAEEDHHEKAGGRDATQVAHYPLAVPYLLNPAGITLLVVFSGALDSWLMLGTMVILVLLVAAFDWLIFTNLDRIASLLDKSRLAVTEAVFGVLLAALAVELVLRGLGDLGVINLVAHKGPFTGHTRLAEGGQPTSGQVAVASVSDSWYTPTLADGVKAVHVLDAKAMRVRAAAG